MTRQLLNLTFERLSLFTSIECTTIRAPNRLRFLSATEEGCAMPLRTWQAVYVSVPVRLFVHNVFT